MRTVNLLPAHYQQARQKNTLRRQITVGSVAVVCACVLWAGVLGVQVHHINKQRSAAIARLIPLQAKWQAIEKNQRACDVLSQKVMTLKTLGDPIALHAVLARLTQLFPDDAVLQSLSIDVPDVPASALPGNNLPGETQSQNSQARRANRRHVKTAANEYQSSKNVSRHAATAVLIELQGLVSSDVVIAKLAGKLAESGVFCNVRIEDAKQITLNEQTFHQFRMSMEIPVYRQPALQLAQGLASR